VVAVVLLSLAVSAACGDEPEARPSGGGVSTTMARETSTSRPPEGEHAAVGSTFVDLLGLMDQGALDGERIYLTNWVPLADEAGLDAPESAAEAVSWLEQLQEASGLPAAGGIPWARTPSEQPDLEREVGFHMGLAHGAIDAGEPPENRIVVVGRFDPLRIDQAVEADEGWRDQLQVVDDESVAYYSWGDEAEIEADPTPARRLGMGGNLYASDRIVAWTNTARAMDSLLGTITDDDRSLADVEVLRLTASALDDHDAYTGLITPAPQVPDRRGILEPYLVAGVGNAFADGRQIGVIVLLNEDATVATANARQLRTALELGETGENGSWSAGDLPLLEVTTDGPLTIATVDLTTDVDLLGSALRGHDTLFLADG
jgi:hypothetical protein